MMVDDEILLGSFFLLQSMCDEFLIDATRFVRVLRETASDARPILRHQRPFCDVKSIYGLTGATFSVSDLNHRSLANNKAHNVSSSVLIHQLYKYSCGNSVVQSTPHPLTPFQNDEVCSYNDVPVDRHCNTIKLQLVSAWKASNTSKDSIAGGSSQEGLFLRASRCVRGRPIRPRVRHSIAR